MIAKGYDVDKIASKVFDLIKPDPSDIGVLGKELTLNGEGYEQNNYTKTD